MRVGEEVTLQPKAHLTCIYSSEEALLILTVVLYEDTCSSDQVEPADTARRLKARSC